MTDLRDILITQQREVIDRLRQDLADLRCVQSIIRAMKQRFEATEDLVAALKFAEEQGTPAVRECARQAIEKYQGRR